MNSALVSPVQPTLASMSLMTSLRGRRRSRGASRSVYLWLCMLSIVVLTGLVFMMNHVTSMTSSHSSSGWMRDNGEIRSFVVDTVGCKIPDFDPFDPQVREFVNESVMVDCNSTSSSPLTFVDGGFLRINRTGLCASC